MSSDGTVKINTELDNSELEKKLSGVDGIVKKGLSGVANVAKLAVTGITAVSGAVAGVATASVNVGMEFEAQMSRVQAISGATKEELKALKDQAVELGAETAFSAQEAAEGMENLASAGFTTSEIMEAMPGMLDLAASSGEDLASSADIAASTLRGFGLEAGEAAHVADVLAKNAADTNAAVADTGEAMKYIAPLARAAGISLEETAAAIGIMADNGIKGGQAGTTLRGALSRLSKPTEDMTEVMDELGISFYDSEGRMRSLSDQIAMLKDATSGLTDEQRNNYLVTLYGQESLSGMLALINSADGELADMTESYRNCDGAAAEMAATMQDNLKSSVEQVGGAAESFGITVYESMQEPLKNTAKTAADAIDQMTEAFKEDGATGAAEAAGDIIANLVTGMAEKTPDVIDMAVTVIQSFTDGIKKNKKKLLGAAGEIVKALADGLVQLLPKQIQKPVKKTVDAITKSFESGGLKKAVGTVSTIFENLCEVTGELADLVLPQLSKALDFLGDNLDVVLPLVTGFFVAMESYKIISKVTESVGAMKGAVQGLFAVMSAHPIGMIIGASAGLLGAIGALNLTTEDAIEAQYGLSDAEQALIDKNTEMAESWQKTKEARDESFSGIESEFGHYDQLWQELQGIVDQNGKIQEGYEERAGFITSTLSEALGIEIQVVDGVIQKYGELNDSIEEVILTKKAEAYLSADEDAYTEAIKNQDEALQNYLTTRQEYTDATKTWEDACDKATEAEEEFNRVADLGGAIAQEAEQKLSDANRERDVAAEKMDSLKESYQGAKDTYEEYASTIANYEGLSAAIISGDAASISESLNMLQNDFLRAETSNRESLVRQVYDMQLNYENLKTAVENGAPGVTQEMVDTAAQMVDLSIAELDKFDDLAAQKGKEGADAYTGGVASGKDDAAQSGHDLVRSTYDSIMSTDFTSTGVKKSLEIKVGLKSQEKAIADQAEQNMIRARDQAESVDSTSVGDNFGSGVKNGMASWMQPVMDQARAMIAAAKAAADDEQDAHSPAKELIKSGHYFGQGVEVGIKDEEGDVAAAGANLARTAINSFNSGFDFHGAADRIRSIMSGRSGYYAAASQIQAGYRTDLTRTDRGGDNATDSIDYNKMAAANAKAMEGMTIEVDERQFGRVVRKVAPA